VLFHASRIFLKAGCAGSVARIAASYARILPLIQPFLNQVTQRY
jgi:hypothetical protein